MPIGHHWKSIGLTYLSSGSVIAALALFGFLSIDATTLSGATQAVLDEADNTSRSASSHRVAR